MGAATSAITITTTIIPCRGIEETDAASTTGGRENRITLIIATTDRDDSNIVLDGILQSVCDVTVTCTTTSQYRCCGIKQGQDVPDSGNALKSKKVKLLKHT